MIITKAVHETMKEWKKEAKISHICLYGRDPDTKGALVIYTDSPGPFIGYRGERHERFEKKVIKASLNSIKKVIYKTTEGIF